MPRAYALYPPGNDFFTKSRDKALESSADLPKGWLTCYDQAFSGEGD